MFEEPKKYWWCFDQKCSWYKTKMTIEDHLEHMIKIHNMKPPEGYVLTIKNKNKIKIKKRKR